MFFGLPASILLLVAATCYCDQDAQMRFQRSLSEAMDNFDREAFNHLDGRDRINAEGKEQAKLMFKFKDANKDGYIDKSEDETFARNFFGESEDAVKESRAHFNMQDANKDGKLDLEETLRHHAVHHGDHDNVHLGRHPTEHHHYLHEEL